MDRLKQLEAFTTQELVGELKRRIAELDEARTMLVAPATGRTSAKNPAMSATKTAYWRDWHAYKAAHPNATVVEWRKAQKRAK